MVCIMDVPGNETTKPGKLLRCPQEGCGKVFRSSPGYRYHLKSHDIDPRPHVCHVCHKKFKSANGLKYHLRKAHHIEPVASKQNLNGNNASSPKDRESLSSEEDHLYNNLNDSYSRGYVNGSGAAGGSYQDRTSSIPPSPLVKSPLGGLNSPLIKNLPPISPLIKSPLDIGPYLSSSSAGSALQSPFPGKDRYTQFYDKRNGDFGRSSLSEYTQQCQQQTNQFRQQCQRLSTGDLSNPRLPSIDFASQRPCDYFNRRPDSYNATIGYNDYNNQKNDELQYTSLNDVKGSITSAKDCRLFSPYKEFAPHEGKEYPGSDLVSNHNLQCAASCSINTNSYNFHDSTADLHGYSNTLNLPGPVQHKNQCSMQNTEQIVPDISSPGCQLSPPTYDRNNNNSKRGASESSVETEFSDSVFQNENSNHQMSPTPPVTSAPLTPVLPSPDIIKNIKTDPDVSTEPTFPASSVESMLQSPKSLLTRRTSRSKSIPPALVINPNPTSAEQIDTKTKELTKKDSNSKLRQLAEIVSASPRSPYNHSPLPTLTPSILAGEGSADWGLKSPSAKFSFPEKNFLLTPTVSRSLGLPETSSTTTEATVSTTTGHSLPQSPFLDNIQTPSFWPSQMWPTPVWLCFLKGCIVKFEQDDKEFMTSEEVADFCTTPGGRKRDNMNFYTSGMKIVGMKTEQVVHSAREIVELTFEQIIPGTQRLVAKCPSDHPFYVKHRGWSAHTPTEAMARYGVPFRALAINDHVIASPTSNKLVATPGTTLSPLVKSSGAQVFTFNAIETKLFTQSAKTKTEPTAFSAPKAPSSNTLTVPQPFSMAATPSASSTTTAKSEEKPKTSIVSSVSSMETITLTFSSKSDHKNNERTQKLVDDFKLLQNTLKERAEKTNSSNRDFDNVSHKSASPDSDASASSIKSPQSVSGDGQMTLAGMAGNQIRKKRRKPLAGNEKDRRPMNGFMLFAKSMRVELTKEFPGKDNRAISKLLGERWRELSEDKREEFARSAKEMADERMKVNPDCWKRKHKKDKEPGAPGGAQKPEGGLINNNNLLTNTEDADIGPPDSKQIKIEMDDDYYQDLPSQENSQSSG